MSPEFLEDQKEISDVEWEQLKQDTIVMRALIRSKSQNASRSYGHILRNLAFAFYPDLLDDTRPEKRSEEYQNATDALSYARRYFKLLEDFPEFAEKELKPGTGYFPELMNQLPGSKPFIDAYEARLRGDQNLGEAEKIV